MGNRKSTKIHNPSSCETVEDECDDYSDWLAASVLAPFFDDLSQALKYCHFRQLTKGQVVVNRDHKLYIIGTGCVGATRLKSYDLILGPGQIIRHGLFEAIVDSKLLEFSPDGRSNVISDLMKEMSDPIKSRKEIPFLKCFPSDGIRSFLNLGQFISFRQKNVVIIEGDKDDRVIISLLGKFMVTSKAEGIGAEQVGPFACFGAIEVALNTPHTATIIAQAPSLALTISGNVFRSVIGAHPDTETKIDHFIRRSMMKKFVPPFLKCKHNIDWTNYCSLAPTIECGTVISTAGTMDDKMYIIARGRIKRVDKGSSPSDTKGHRLSDACAAADVELSELTAGSYFGEENLMPNAGPIGYSVMANARDCVLVTISKTQYEKLVADYPELDAQVQLYLLQEKATLSAILTMDGALEAFRQFLKDQIVPEFKCLTDILGYEAMMEPSFEVASRIRDENLPQISTDVLDHINRQLAAQKVHGAFDLFKIQVLDQLETKYGTSFRGSSELNGLLTKNRLFNMQI